MSINNPERIEHADHKLSQECQEKDLNMAQSLEKVCVEFSQTMDQEWVKVQDAAKDLTGEK